ncbi:hypothetical protein M758_6G093500 [Ceratodon purpureus]|nr:hypothetical protein M758_6G093500 [Ceratodon purpureus]
MIRNSDLRTDSRAMEQRRRGPTLEPVLENNHMGPSTAITLTTQPSTRYKPHKYGTVAMKVEDEAKSGQCICVKPLRYFGKLRDRYIKAMNEMAMGGDFTGLAGYHGAGGGAHECSYTMERSRSVKDRQEEALQEELAAMMRSKSQAHRDSISQVHPS